MLSVDWKDGYGYSAPGYLHTNQKGVTDCLVGKLSSAVLSLTGAQGHDQIGTPSMQCCNYDKPERKLTQH